MIKLTKEDMISKVYVNPEDIMTVEDREMLYGKVVLRDGTIINTVEGAAQIMSKITEDLDGWKITRKDED